MVKIKVELTNQHPGGMQTATILTTEACTSEPRVVLETFDALVARFRAVLVENTREKADA